MSSKLIPANPAEVMVIRNVTPNVVTLSVPFLRFGIMRVGGRGTLVRLSSGSLAVFSPVALTDEVKAKVAELGGRLAYIVALDFEHHIFVSEWAAAYPDAAIVGPEGLPEKRAKSTDEKVAKEERAFATVFTVADKGKTTIGAEFDADFDYEYIPGHPTKEIVFNYKPDGVLIEADLLFNLPAVEQFSKVPEAEKKGHAFLNKIFQAAQTAHGDLKYARRFQWYAASSKDRKAFNESITAIAAWNFDIIVPCHGEVIEKGGKEAFTTLFEWHLKGTKA